MTTQTQVIIFCVMGAVAVPLGTFVAIKCIKKLWATPETVLHSRGDIELNYIEPIQPQHVYHPVDLLEEPYPIYDRFSNHASYGYDRVHSYFSGNPPSYLTGTGTAPTYQSGTIPSYHSTDRYNIYCALENENIINHKFILWLTLFLAIILSIVILISLEKEGSQSILVPFSFFEIGFRDSFEWKFNSYGDKPKISYLKIQTLTEDIIKLLNSLKDDGNYSMSLSFISSYKKWKDNKDKVIPLLIDNAIIINKESDPILITQFIMNRLNDKGHFVTNWLFNDSSINSMDPVVLTVTVAIKVEI